jgi:hypothetical protein
MFWGKSNGPKIHCFLNIFRLSHARKKRGRKVRKFFPEFSKALQPIHPGHIQIKKDQIRSFVTTLHTLNRFPKILARITSASGLVRST